MPHRILPLLVWALTLLALPPLGAGAPKPLPPDPGRLPFVILGPDEGLPTAGPLCLAQDRAGFIWMGTEAGLLRYDRGHPRLYTEQDGLPSPYVSRLLPARGGGLWVQTYEGIVRFREGRFEPLQLGGAPGKPDSDLMTLDHLGRLWVLTSRGFFVEGEGPTFEPRTWPVTWRPRLLHAGTRSQWLYTASDEGVRAYLPDGTSRSWGRSEGVALPPPTLLAEDGEGRLWLGAGRKLLMKEPGADRFTDQSRLLPGSLSPNSAPFLEVDGSLWLPTQSGALRISGGGVERLDSAAGLPFRWVRTVLRDSEGSLWVVGPSLARLQGGGRVRNHAISAGDGGETVWGLLRDGDGSLLVGTDDGAARLGPAGLVRVPGTEGHRIKGLGRDARGNLWMASSTGPTLWIPGGRDRAVVAPLGEAGLFTHAVMTDSKGRTWVGSTRQGVLRLDPRTLRLSPELGAEGTGATFLSVYSFVEDRDGRIWAGSSEGLLVRERDGTWHRFTEREGLPPHIIRGVAFLPDGSAWIHNQEPRGIVRVRLEEGRLRILEQRGKGSGLRSDLVYGLAVDGRGRLWVSTDQGLDRLEPPLHVGQREGMVSEDCSVHALLAEGTRIWVGTLAGLVRYEAGPVSEAPPPPQAVVVSASFGGQRREPPFGTLPPFPHRAGTAEFRVSAPTYLNEAELHFQVRLTGLEEAWRDLEGRVAHYPALPGGTYRFEVRAAQGAGAYGPPAGLAFRVSPPWWHSWPFRLAALAAAGFAVVGLVRWRLAALARAKHQLEGLVGERTRELQVRNEELSAALTRVKQLSGLLPICSCCKKIRDDKGYWNQLENYISAHSEADFTHGICPDCSEVLYPEITRRRAKPDPAGGK